MTIHLLFASNNYTNSSNLLESVKKQLNTNQIKKSVEVKVTAFDKTTAQHLSRLKPTDSSHFGLEVVPLDTILELENKYLGEFQKANCTRAVDSIQRARIQQQIYIKDNFEEFRNCVIWQVDDDMLFCDSPISDGEMTFDYSFNYFQNLADLYAEEKTKVDVLIGKSTYAPPIPSLLYTYSQLKDVLEHSFAPNMPFDEQEYHDYYNREIATTSYPINLYPTKSKEELVKLILTGLPVTRPVLMSKHEKAYKKPSKYLRGGNFIVFNPEIFLKVPHLGFAIEADLPSRRSDMIHSRLLGKFGYNICDTDYFSLVHNRCFKSVDFSKNVEKYYKDYVGSLLVQYLFSPKTLDKRFLFHQSHLSDIANLLTKHGYGDLFAKKIKQLQVMQEKINVDSLPCLKERFRKFEHIFNTTKTIVCKSE